MADYGGSIEDNKKHGVVKEESIECCVYYVINPRMPESNSRPYAHTQKKKKKKKERKTNQVVY